MVRVLAAVLVFAAAFRCTQLLLFDRDPIFGDLLSLLAGGLFWLLAARRRNRRVSEADQSE